MKLKYIKINLHIIIWLLALIPNISSASQNSLKGIYIGRSCEDQGDSYKSLDIHREKILAFEQCDPRIEYYNDESYKIVTDARKELFYISLMPDRKIYKLSLSSYWDAKESAGPKLNNSIHELKSRFGVPSLIIYIRFPRGEHGKSLIKVEAYWNSEISGKKPLEKIYDERNCGREFWQFTKCLGKYTDELDALRNKHIRMSNGVRKFVKISALAPINDEPRIYEFNIYMSDVEMEKAAAEENSRTRRQLDKAIDKIKKEKEKEKEKEKLPEF